MAFGGRGGGGGGPAAAGRMRPRAEGRDSAATAVEAMADIGWMQLQSGGGARPGGAPG